MRAQSNWATTAESIERAGVSAIRTRFGTGLLALFGGAALLLLLACVNIAGLLLARPAGREREMAVRAALGATRGRLMRHWLAESALLAAAGGLGGLLLAKVGLTLATSALPAVRDLGTGGAGGYHARRALRFCWPSARQPHCSLGVARPANLNDSKTVRPRRAVCAKVLNVAAATTLVLAVSSRGVTLHRLASAPAGFDRDHVVTFTMDTEFARYTPEQNRALALRLEREARTISGVAQAGIASRSLMRGAGFKTAVA
jgi:cell division protein FtsX